MTENTEAKTDRVVPMRVIVCGLQRTGTLSELPYQDSQAKQPH
jgi:hypothetical protein